MNTCETCGHDADRSRIDQAFVEEYEVNAAYIINRALTKLGSECWAFARSDGSDGIK